MSIHIKSILAAGLLATVSALPLNALAQSDNPYAAAAQQQEHDQYIHDQSEGIYNSMIQDMHDRQDEATKSAWWNQPSPSDSSPPPPPSVVASYTYIIYQHQDPIPIFTERANNGDAEAARGLGEMYATGTGVAQDEAQSAAWFGKGADEGDTESQAVYGMLLMTGKGVARDPVAGTTYLKQASDKGDIVATANLGLAYEIGDGVSQDATEAARLYRIAADAGNAAGETGLGRYEILGEGVDPDPESGIQLMKAASDQGNIYAMMAYATALGVGKYGLTADPDEAFRLLTIAANAGNTAAMGQLGDYYASGLARTADAVTAVSWWEKAGNDDDALANLAITYYNGADGVPQDLNKAYSYASQAAKLGDDQMAGMAQDLAGRGYGG